MARATADAAMATVDPRNRIPVIMTTGSRFCRKLRSIPPVLLPVPEPEPPVPLPPPLCTESVLLVEPWSPALSATSRWALKLPEDVGLHWKLADDEFCWIGCCDGLHPGMDPLNHRK